MKRLEKDERILCELQGSIFEKSASEYKTSSGIFVRRYMNSEYASVMDRMGFIDRPTNEKEAFESLNEEYGESEYGSEIYSADELYWIGYIYRYWAILHNVPSRVIYKMCNVRYLHRVYYAYHTLDPENAIERILEAKGIYTSEEDQTQYGVRLLRKIREKGQIEKL